MAAPGPNRALTPKQQRFVDEYVIDANASKAAIRAGYSARNASRIGPELLGKTCVAVAISLKQQRKAERNDITADRTLQELALLAFSNLLHYRLDAQHNLTLTPDAPPEAMRAVAWVKHKIRTIVNEDGERETQHEVEYKLWDKNTALTNLAKHFKLLVDRVELVGPFVEAAQRLAAERGMTYEEVLAEAQALAGSRD